MAEPEEVLHEVPEKVDASNATLRDTVLSLDETVAVIAAEVLGG